MLGNKKHKEEYLTIDEIREQLECSFAEVYFRRKFTESDLPELKLFFEKEMQNLQQENLLSSDKKFKIEISIYDGFFHLDVAEKKA